MFGNVVRYRLLCFIYYVTVINSSWSMINEYYEEIFKVEMLSTREKNPRSRWELWTMDNFEQENVYIRGFCGQIKILLEICSVVANETRAVVYQYSNLWCIWCYETTNCWLCKLALDKTKNLFTFTSCYNYYVFGKTKQRYMIKS